MNARLRVESCGGMLTVCLFCRAQAMFLVLDADALLLVGQDPSSVRGYRRAILTPNVMEFKRLSEQLVRRRLRVRAAR